MPARKKPFNILAAYLEHKDNLRYERLYTVADRYLCEFGGVSLCHIYDDDQRDIVLIETADVLGRLGISLDDLAAMPANRFEAAVTDFMPRYAQVLEDLAWIGRAECVLEVQTASPNSL